MIEIKGNQDSFPTTITLPDGRVLRGNQDSFPVAVTLPDGSALRRNPEPVSSIEGERDGKRS